MSAFADCDLPWNDEDVDDYRPSTSIERQQPLSRKPRSSKITTLPANSAQYAP